jgi:hypothetical protein
MKHQKRVTDAVRAANQANAQSSTGPRTDRGKAHSRNNALRHGLLARKVVLDTHEQRAEFRELRRRCERELHPKGVFENFVVEDIATMLFKLGIIEPLVVRELLRRQDLSDSDNLKEIFDNGFFHKDLKLPIECSDLPLNRGLDCKQMSVRAVAGKDRHYSHTLCGPPISNGAIVPAAKASTNNDSQNADHLEIAAVMGNALETLTRYETKLRRELYRAIGTFHKVKMERRERKN